MPDFIKGFQNIKENSPQVSWCVAIKSFRDFMYNWQQFCSAWVTRYETWLGLCKKFVLHKVIKQRVEYKPFKYFTEDRKKPNWMIIFIKFVLSFLWTGTTFLFFESSSQVFQQSSSNIDLQSNWSGKIISFHITGSFL